MLDRSRQCQYAAKSPLGRDEERRRARPARARPDVLLGGGVLTDLIVTNEQQEWFLDGYRPHRVDTDLNTYYRSSRVLEDAFELARTVLDPANTCAKPCTT